MFTGLDSVRSLYSKTEEFTSLNVQQLGGGKNRIYYSRENSVPSQLKACYLLLFLKLSESVWQLVRSIAGTSGILLSLFGSSANGLKENMKSDSMYECTSLL